MDATMTAEPRHGYLVVIARSGADGKAFPMHSERVVIGRQETCDIRMQRPEVSKQHCTIHATDNKVVLRNLSENGTMINGRVLSVGQQAALSSGDLITVVGRSLRYEAPKHQHTPVRPLPRPHPNTDTQALAQRRGSANVRLGNNAPASARMRRLSAGLRPHNPETARKLKLWHAHYSAQNELLAESPPPQLYESCGDLPTDDVFAKPTASGSDTKLFRQLAAVVEPAGESLQLGGASELPPRDAQLAGEVARIMDEISRLAHGNSPTTRVAEPNEPVAAAKSTESVELAERLERTPRRSQPRTLYPPLEPQRLVKPVASASGKNHDTSPENRPPEVAKAGRSPAEFFASLRRPSMPVSSPLKRTLSSGGPARAPSRPLATRPSPTEAAEASDDVPTEPEPDSDGDGDGTNEAPVLVTPKTPSTRPAALVATPSGARKSVRFGPALSPEVFDAHAPPSTPLRRGTPMPIARASSILRMAAAAAGSVEHPTPRPAPPQLVFRSLLQPRMTRRKEVHRCLAALAALDEQPAECVVQPVQLKRPADVLADAPAAELKTVDEPSRRRRSVRLAREGRRATLAAALPPPPLALPQSPALVVRTCAGVYSPIKAAAEAAVEAASLESLGDSRRARRERRRTAPAGSVRNPPLAADGDADGQRMFGDFGASIAAMAAALGEDVPVLPFAQPPGGDKRSGDACVQSSDSGEESDAALPLPEALSPMCEHPLGLADAMHMQLQLNDTEAEAEAEASSAMPVPVMRPTSAARLSSSETLLLEQARLQARLINPGDPDALDDARRSRRARRQTTSVLDTLSDADVPLPVQPLHTTPAAGMAAGSDDNDEGVLDTDDLLARRQRLRRMQERKRRRQTIAELKKRRSSWRGWMPANSPAGSPMRTADLLSSPPRSPSPEPRSRDPSAAIQPARSDAILTAHVPASSRSQPPFTSRPVSPPAQEEAVGSSGSSSDASSSFASSLNGNFNTLNLRTSGMYPPPLWNSSSDTKPNSTGSAGAAGSMLAAASAEGSPTKRRRLADYVAGAFGLRSSPPSSSASAAHGDSDAAKHAYPPRPLSIDADWEHVDASAIPTPDTPAFASATAAAAAAAEITASAPADAANEHGLIAVGRGDDLDDEIRPHMSASLSSASESLRNQLLPSKKTALPAASNTPSAASASASAAVVKPRAKPSNIALHMQKRPSATNITSRLPSRQNSAASISRINTSSSSSSSTSISGRSTSGSIRAPSIAQKKSDTLNSRQMQQQQQQQQNRLPEPKTPRNRRNTMHAAVSSKTPAAAVPAAPALTRSARKRKIDSAQPALVEPKPAAQEPLTRRRASSAVRRPTVTATSTATTATATAATDTAPAQSQPVPAAALSTKNRRRTLAAETPSRRAPVPKLRTPPTTRSAKRTKRA